MDPAELAHRHAYHQPKDDATRAAHELVRELTGNLAATLNEVLPEGREKSLALTHVDYAQWAANAAIARGGGPRTMEVTNGDTGT